MTAHRRLWWLELEELTHRDPANRKLPAARVNGNFLDAGQLEQAAESLAAAESVAIVTGFCTLDADPPAAETDGPPGALYLARALLALGVRVQLISDCYGLPLLRVGCRHWNLPATMIVEAPWQPNTPTAFRQCGQWCLGLAATGDWTHLVSIERPGPLSDTGARSLQQLRRLISTERWHAGQSCYNMRGSAIDAVTAPLHTLFQAARLLPQPIKTIGMADGGNEIGVGKLSWQQVHDALGRPAGEETICRVPTDFLLLAGVSNWAAYALAGAVCVLHGRKQLLAGWPVEDHGRLIETLVREGGAVDGTSGARQPSVDGLPLTQYLSMLAAIQEFLIK